LRSVRAELQQATVDKHLLEEERDTLIGDVGKADATAAAAAADARAELQRYVERLQEAEEETAYVVKRTAADAAALLAQKEELAVGLCREQGIAEKYQRKWERLKTDFGELQTVIASSQADERGLLEAQIKAKQAVESELERTQATASEGAEKITHLESELAMLGQEHMVAQNDLLKTTQGNLDFGERVHTLTTQLAARDAEVAAAVARVDALQARYGGLETDKSASDAAVAELTAKLDDAHARTMSLSEKVTEKTSVAAQLKDCIASVKVLTVERDAATEENDRLEALWRRGEKQRLADVKTMSALRLQVEQHTLSKCETEDSARGECATLQVECATLKATLKKATATHAETLFAKEAKVTELEASNVKLSQNIQKMRRIVVQTTEDYKAANGDASKLRQELDDVKATHALETVALQRDLETNQAATIFAETARSDVAAQLESAVAAATAAAAENHVKRDEHDTVLRVLTEARNELKQCTASAADAAAASKAVANASARQQAAAAKESSSKNATLRAEIAELQTSLTAANTSISCLQSASATVTAMSSDTQRLREEIILECQQREQAVQKQYNAKAAADAHEMSELVARLKAAEVAATAAAAAVASAKANKQNRSVAAAAASSSAATAADALARQQAAAAKESSLKNAKLRAEFVDLQTSLAAAEASIVHLLATSAAAAASSHTKRLREEIIELKQRERVMQEQHVAKAAADARDISELAARLDAALAAKEAVDVAAEMAATAAAASLEADAKKSSVAAAAASASAAATADKLRADAAVLQERNAKLRAETADAAALQERLAEAKRVAGVYKTMCVTSERERERLKHQSRSKLSRAKAMVEARDEHILQLKGALHDVLENSVPRVRNVDDDGRLGGNSADAAAPAPSYSEPSSSSSSSSAAAAAAEQNALPVRLRPSRVLKASSRQSGGTNRTSGVGIQSSGSSGRPGTPMADDAGARRVPAMVDVPVAAYEQRPPHQLPFADPAAVDSHAALPVCTLLDLPVAARVPPPVGPDMPLITCYERPAGRRQDSSNDS
jgi:hypothetical protein